MQYRAANTQTMSCGKTGFGRRSVFHEANAVKWKTVADVRGDTEAGQRRHAVGHEALAARFVDRRLRAIGDHNLEAAPARSDRRGQPGGTAADHEDVGFTRQPVHRSPPDENHL
jgi:hypothetical protein